MLLQEERAIAQEKHDQLMIDVAGCLGADWQLVQINSSKALQQGDMRLSVHFGWFGQARGRMEIGLWLSHDQLGVKSSREHAPTITVSDDRAPEAIAKDILRRLVPDARKMHDNLSHWVQIKVQEEADRKALIAKLAACLEIPVKPDHTGAEDHLYEYIKPGPVVVEITSHGNSADLSFKGVPVAVAEAICKALHDAIGQIDPWRPF